MMSDTYASIARDGLWDNNVVFGQMLALCPLLAATGTATKGLGMGLATTAVLVASGLAVSLLRGAVLPEIRIPTFVLVIACIVTVVDMALNAWSHDLHHVLGLFIPLIVTNCAILRRAEAFASRNRPLASAFDGLMMGLGFTPALVVLGAAREILGPGTLFANASVLLGESVSFLEITVILDYQGFLLLILPPGGFIVLGILLALKALADQRVRTEDARRDAPQGRVFTFVGVQRPPAPAPAPEGETSGMSASPTPGPPPRSGAASPSPRARPYGGAHRCQRLVPLRCRRRLATARRRDDHRGCAPRCSAHRRRRPALGPRRGLRISARRGRRAARPTPSRAGRRTRRRPRRCRAQG